MKKIIGMVAGFAAAIQVLLTGPLAAGEVRIMASGGFTAALKLLAPKFEQATGNKVEIILGPSMGTAPEAIPARLQRGEPADLVVIVGYALDELVKKGLVGEASVVKIADSKIGMSVREGAPKPDISTLDAFKKTLLAAKSIAYSDSASGVYIAAEMYKKLGLEAELAPKSRKIIADPVGGEVAAGRAEIGFQQVSELLASKGATFVGVIPPEVQKVTVYSAGIPAKAPNADGAKAFLAFVNTPDARKIVADTGLEPTP